MAQSIRESYAYSFRNRWKSNTIASPIRDLAIMVRDCKAKLTQQGYVQEANEILNLTIGDVEPRNFSIDGHEDIAKNLGLNPYGHTRINIDEKISTLRNLAWNTGGEPRSGYQPEAIGMPRLREHYANYMSVFGIPYNQSETVLTFGSLHGIESLLQTLFVENNKDVTLVAPTPGFSVIHTQGMRLGLDVQKILTTSETGYCPTSEDIQHSLVDKNYNKTILYLTPMNNPTSTVYNPVVLENALKTFKALRPDGVVLLDMAYMEMVPYEKTVKINQAIQNAGVLENSVMSLSMSKIFSYPRLRSAALLTKNKDILAGLRSTAQVNYASISGSVELEATAMWEHVTPQARQEYFNLLSQRQAKLLKKISPYITQNIHTDIPMYVYAQLKPEYDFMDLFIKKGICGVPGEVFGDDPKNRMVRFSTGTEPLTD